MVVVGGIVVSTLGFLIVVLGVMRELVAIVVVAMQAIVLIFIVVIIIIITLRDLIDLGKASVRRAAL